jgi:hypothetical protein
VFFLNKAHVTPVETQDQIRFLHFGFSEIQLNDKGLTHGNLHV